MSSSYSGVSSVPMLQATITEPSDGDALTGASAQTPLQALANQVKTLGDQLHALAIGNVTARAHAHTSQKVNGFAFGNGLWVCAGNVGQSYAVDAISWTSGGTDVFTSVAFGAGLFVGVTAAGAIKSSPDGAAWTVRTSALGTLTSAQVVFANGLFVIAGGDASHTQLQIQTSPDGITWTARQSGGGAGSSTVYVLRYVGSLWVAIASAGSNTVWTSPDAITWTARTPGSATIVDVAYIGGLYLVQGGAAPYMQTTPDFVTFTTRTIAGGAGLICMAAGTTIVAGADGTKMYSSPDGITWTTRSTTSPVGGFGAGSLPGNLIWTGAAFVVIGDGANYGTSFDALTWRVRAHGLSLTTDLSAVAFLGGILLIGSDTGTNLASSTQIQV